MARSCDKREIIFWISNASSFMELQMINEVVYVDQDHYKDSEKMAFLDLIKKNAFRLELEILNKHRNG